MANGRIYLSRKCERISRTALIASTALDTIWDAREELASSVNFASSNSALAKMMPSLLLSRWKRGPRSAGWSIWRGSVCKGGNGTWLRIASATLPIGLRCGYLAPARIRLSPKSVNENANRTTGGSNVFDLATGDPVVDRSTAHADQITGLHDRNRFPIDYHRYSHLAHHFSTHLVPRTVPLVTRSLSGGIGTESKRH